MQLDRFAQTAILTGQRLGFDPQVTRQSQFVLELLAAQRQARVEFQRARVNPRRQGPGVALETGIDQVVEITQVNSQASDHR